MGGVAAGLLAAVSLAGGVARAQETLLAAHRGGARLWPENSLRAFRGALALGADLLELDVHLTRDGAVVVLHDPTLERTTTGSGEVRAAALQELRRLRLKDEAGRATDEPVPTLDEVLDLLAPTPAGLLLEIKTGPGRERYDGIEERVLGRLRAWGLQGRTVLMSFDPGVLQRVRELDPAIRAGLLVSRRALRHGGVSAEVAVGWAVAAGAADLGLEHTLVTGPVLEAARARGLRVAAWTVNDDADMRRLIGLGVDILITDRPDLARGLLRR